MLTHPTVEKLHALGLTGMARALEEQRQHPDIDSLGFEERLGLMVDREAMERDNRRLKNRVKKAALRLQACVEDIDYRHPRGLDRSLVHGLSSCEWIGARHNLLVTGPTGCGKTYLACALAQKACREGYSAQYLRMPRLSHQLMVARADGRYAKVLAGMGKVDLLLLDDFGLAALSDEHRRDLLEIVEERCERRSTLVTSQLPVSSWHEYLGDPTLADAILDRLISNAYKIALKGESMRPKRTKPAQARAGKETRDKGK